MSALDFRDAPLRILPDTEQIARRLLANAEVLSQEMPFGIGVDAFNILLVLYSAEDSGECQHLAELSPPGSQSITVVQRWIAALEAEGLVERSTSLIALSPAGHAKVQRILERMYEAQCRMG